MSLPNPTPNRPGRPPGEKPSAPQGDAWSLRIATVSGIPIRLHFTFLLLLIWLALAGLGRGSGAIILFLLGIFFCVALHELGHSLVAQRYGYQVRDIVLYPIGGVASIEGSPRARHELWIALAGPAVNVVIAGLLGAYLGVTGALPPTTELLSMRTLAGDPVAALMRANIFLVLFNMIPAFPMDGGRVLRALLALRLPRHQATAIAARIGQALAIVFGVYGFMQGNFGLMLIAVFVYFGAGQEAAAEQSRVDVEGENVDAAMVKEFTTLSTGDSLRRASEVLIATHQQDFPVVFGDQVVGVLSRGALLRTLAQQGESAYVSEAMDREVVFAKPSDPLESILMSSEGIRRAPVLVMDEGRLVGMLTVDNLMEFLTLRQIVRARAEQGP